MISTQPIRNSPASPDQQLASAVRDCNTPLVCVALAGGADPNYRECGRPMMVLAAELGSIKLLRRLLDLGGASVHQADDRGFTPLHMASECGHCQAVRLLLQHGARVAAQDNKGWTPLHYATYKGHRRATELLLLAGASPNPRDINGRTPLFWGPIVHDDLKLARILFSHGADVEAIDARGNTPLHYAAQMGRTGIIDTFLRHGANIHAFDKNGYTALHYAAQLHEPRTATMLLKNGADFRMIDRHGNTPLHLAALFDRPNVVLVFLAVGADPMAQNKSGQSPLDLAVGPRRGIGGEGAVAMLRRNPKIPSLTICRLLRNTVRRAIWVQGSNALVSELLDRGVSPASLNAQDFQIMLAHAANHNRANGTTGIPQKILEVARMLANRGCRIPPHLTCELL
jgi:ankyrin repeat protein